MIADLRARKANMVVCTSKLTGPRVLRPPKPLGKKIQSRPPYRTTIRVAIRMLHQLQRLEALRWNSG